MENPFKHSIHLSKKKLLMPKGMHAIIRLSMLPLHFLTAHFVQGQHGYWQQEINYVMDVQLDVKTNKLTGTQSIRYTNHSPDTLFQLYFHTYWNAFQPGSNMDHRSRQFGEIELGKTMRGNIKLDWDARIADRINKLKPEEEGYTRILSCLMDGKELEKKAYETVTQIVPTNPVTPGKTIQLEVKWESQVPIQIRRSGRDSKEGIAYTMTQWYPKMAAYDKRGWHPESYVGREFYGTWGDFEVNISLDKNYKIGAGGVLQNSEEIGWGYDKEGTHLKPTGSAVRIWRFKAEKVHDFAWAADPEFSHFTRQAENGPILHFIFKEEVESQKRWHNMADTLAEAYPFIRENFGAYPWPVYSFIHGGDGGMEYALSTMIKEPSINAAIHEWVHSWYQQLLGTNENRFAWMDEGFTTFAEARINYHIFKPKGIVPNWTTAIGYMMNATSPFKEPLSTPANFFTTNYAYNSGSYMKGGMFLVQIGYLAGEEALKRILLSYYNQWQFKSPEPDDFLKIAEKESGLQLAWFMDVWIGTIKDIDYDIDTLVQGTDKAELHVKRVGEIPMPLDIVITYATGENETHFVPLDLLLGSKPDESNQKMIRHPMQKWANRDLKLMIDTKGRKITKIEIDPSMRLADVSKQKNVWERK